jgi:O-antigen/teichoic acid export membrane protein
LFKNIGSTWVLILMQAVVLMKLTPFVIDKLGLSQYGMWAVIVGITGYVRLLILGIPLASVRYTAEHVAKEDSAGANRAISTCIGICLLLGVVAWIVGGIAYPIYDSAYLTGKDAADLSQASIDGARLAFAIVMLQVGMAFAMRLPYGIFDAHGDFVLRNAVMVGELCLRLALTIGLLWWKPTLVSLALVQVICMLAEFGAMLVLIRRRYPRIRLGLRDFDKSLVRSILSFSIFAMVLNVGALLAFQTDALVIGKFIGLKETAEFEVGNKFFDPMTQLLIGVSAVVMPLATRLKATGDLVELRHVFLKWSKICLSIVLLVGLYLLVLGPEFIGMWMGPEFVVPSGRVLQVLMLSFLIYLPVRGVAIAIMMGLGKPAAPAISFLGMGALNLVMSIALAKPLGILGVALGTAIPNVLFAVTILVMACKELGVELGQYIGYVTVRALVGAIAPFALLAWCKYGLHVQGLVPLLAAGIAQVIVFAAIWILFVFRGDPYLDLHAALSRLRRK